MPYLSDITERFFVNYRGTLEDKFFDSATLQYNCEKIASTIVLWKDGLKLFVFTLQEQINCCAIIVDTANWAGSPEDFSREEFVTLLKNILLLKEQIAVSAGYSMMLATVNITDNPTFVDAYNSCGWNLADEVTNLRTDNLVGIYTKIIRGNSN